MPWESGADHVCRHNLFQQTTEDQFHSSRVKGRLSGRSVVDSYFLFSRLAVPLLFWVMWVEALKPLLCLLKHWSGWLWTDVDDKLTTNHSRRAQGQLQTCDLQVKVTDQERKKLNIKLSMSLFCLFICHQKSIVCVCH